MTFRIQGYFKDISRIFQGYYLKHDEITHKLKIFFLFETGIEEMATRHKMPSGRFLGSSS